MVRISLVDDEANVRAAAAQAFDILQEELGAKAIDQTIPTLLEALRQPGKGSGTALEALREVMGVRLLPHLLYQSLCNLGSSDSCVPSSYTYAYGDPDDGVQCSCTCFIGDGCWECPEQAVDCHLECSR